MTDINKETSLSTETNMDENTGKLVADLQESLIDILEEVVHVFDKNGLKYSLVAGTLLGAIRHKGFIPWDDDLDIIMPRDDFEKFKKIAPQELSEKLFFQDYTTDCEYPSIYAKVRNSKTTLIENGYRKLKKMNHGVFLDIFVADRYKPGLKNNFRRKLIKFYSSILLFQKVAEINKLYQGISRLFPRNLLFRLTENISRKMDSEKGTNQYIMMSEYIMPDGIFDELVEVPFERLNVKISKKYDEMLTDMFGDYMQLPPVEKRQPKHIAKHLSLTTPYKKYMEENIPEN